MPTFDVVSEVNMHEVSNATDQANRELSTRFDFNGVDAHFKFKEGVISLFAVERFQLKQMVDILLSKCSRRGLDVAALESGKIEGADRQVRQDIQIRQGIDSDSAKKITQLVKKSKLKLQASVQGDKVRITSKKKDDLQAVMSLIKEQGLSVPVQFNNFRD